MEKPKNNNVPIDPLLAQQYFADAASKARGIIEWPAHEVAERPSHEIVPVVDPDREAAKKASEAHQDYNFMKQFYENDVDAMRGVKEARAQADYAVMMGKDPASFVGVQTPGTIKNFIGPSENSVIRTIDAKLIENTEREAIESADKSAEKFLENLPEGVPPMTPAEKRDFVSRPLFRDPPYDQDAEENKTNAA